MNLRKISAAALSMAVSLICISAGAQGPGAGAGANPSGPVCKIAWDGMAKDEAVQNKEIVFLAPFVEPVLVIESAGLTEGTPDQIAQALLGPTVRQASLIYQETSKFTYNWFKKNTQLAQRQYDLNQKMKRLENLIGRTTDAFEYARKISKTKASAETVQAARDKAQNIYKMFLKTIQDEGWAGPNATAYQEFLDFFGEVRKAAPNQKELSDAILKEMKHLMKKIQTTEWDMEDLEGETGLHKFRRMIRRLLLLREVLIDRIQVLEGVKVPKKWKFFQTISPDLGNEGDLRKYLGIHYSDRKIKDPIYVSMEWLRGLSVAVVLFGKYKDWGQLFESAMEAYRRDPDFPGEKKGRAFIEKQLRKKYNWRPYQDETKTTYDLFMDSGLLSPDVFMDKIPEGAKLAPETEPKSPRK